MGMAASQARLLTITARLADNELRSQTINNAKMRLATQSSQASENYINALNNATLKFSNYDEAGNAMSQDLTYNALTAYSSYNTQYGLINSAGQILVSESEAAIFANSKGNLNAYLLAHGLEYTTTYFDQLGAIKNDAYPAPFNNISVEDMQTYYEQYGSYENSVEVENYTSLYSNYIKSSADLVKGSAVAMEAFLTTSNWALGGFTFNTDLLSIGDAGATIESVNNAVGLDNKLDLFTKVFTQPANQNTNTYNINYLEQMGIIPTYIADTLRDKVNAYEKAPYTTTTTTPSGQTVNVTHERIKYSEQSTLVLPNGKDEDGNEEYILGEGVKITVDPSGNVIAIDDTEAKAAYNDEDAADDNYTRNFTLHYPTNDDDTLKSLPLADFINQLSFTLEGTDNGTDYSYDQYFNYEDNNGVKKLTTYTYVEDQAQLNTLLNMTTDEIINTIIECANYEKFADLLISLNGQNSNNLPPNVKDILGNEIPGLNKSLEELLNEYQGDKSNFLGFIFHQDSIAQVEDDLANGAEAFLDEEGKPVLVTPANLTDIDFVLQYLKAKGLKQSESFNTVIKEFLVEQMIEVYGEPKYAWVDINDTTNKGNADAKAQWYTNLFNRMNQGYKALENGLASSKEWMEYALEAGIVSLEQVDKNFRWNGLSYKTCTRITEETDDAAVTKAEAEYNRAMNDIEAKDNIFDMELKNIDTEHSALQTEYDVIKGVIDKNISRTFKFNQSA